MVQNLLEFHYRNTVNKTRYVLLNIEQIYFSTLILTCSHCILKYKVKLEKWQTQPPASNNQTQKTPNQKKPKRILKWKTLTNTFWLKPLHSAAHLSVCAQPLPSALTILCLFQSKTSKARGFLLEDPEVDPCLFLSVSDSTQRHETFSGYTIKNLQN